MMQNPLLFFTLKFVVFESTFNLLHPNILRSIFFTLSFRFSSNSSINLQNHLQINLYTFFIAELMMWWLVAEE
ncbi:hypothetical protein TSUD_182880 [Trifolium subterraneum]|uniref:Uncharacterized protein n=1 Tax=Trifolium subterraneum TaxID=3900 RepID=A0A2Z6PI25_TRISU|nr:hypothetical protein TSUD_182880 [Trifolium subterraneum]